MRVVIVGICMALSGLPKEFVRLSHRKLSMPPSPSFAGKHWAQSFSRDVLDGLVVRLKQRSRIAGSSLPKLEKSRLLCKDVISAQKGYLNIDLHRDISKAIFFA
jgi:hypothetical protein